MVLLTDDGYHSLSIATLGDFDATRQAWVTGQPYSVGVLLSGSNTSTWTAHQSSDLAFKLKCAVFSAKSRVVDAGNFVLTNVTDLVVFAGVDIPASDTSIIVRLTRADGTIYRVLPGQPIRFDTRVSESVNVKFELTGTEIHSPVLYPFVQMFKGEQSDTGDYWTRASVAGASARVVLTYEVLLPGSSTVAAKIGNPGSVVDIPVDRATALGDGWLERTHILTPYSGDDVRSYLLLTGTPKDRPRVRGVRTITTNQPVNITA
jgi:hypothetical protein